MLGKPNLITHYKNLILGRMVRQTITCTIKQIPIYITKSINVGTLKADVKNLGTWPTGSTDTFLILPASGFIADVGG